jgi:hypothetical protein
LKGKENETATRYQMLMIWISAERPETDTSWHVGKGHTKKRREITNERLSQNGEQQKASKIYIGKMNQKDIYNDKENDKQIRMESEIMAQAQANG